MVDQVDTIKSLALDAVFTMGDGKDPLNTQQMVFPVPVMTLETATLRVPLSRHGNAALR